MSGAEFVPAAAKAAGSAAAPAGRWLTRRFVPDTSQPALQAVADALAARLQATEHNHLSELQAGRAGAVEVSFQRQLQMQPTDGVSEGTLFDVGAYYMSLPSRRLVVLGEPGAGKTVLALYVLLDLIEERAAVLQAHGRRLPVPVRVNAARWNPDMPLGEWFAGAIANDHGLPRKVARELVNHGMVFPVLDGLDEMDDPGGQNDWANAAIDRLNADFWTNRPVIVTCRSQAYTGMCEARGDAGVQATASVMIQALTAPDISRYLTTACNNRGIAFDQWAPVIEQLRKEPAGILATTLQTPWMITLTVRALARGKQALAQRLVACTDTDQVQRVLFALMIPAAIGAIPDTGRHTEYTTEVVHFWLHNLARHLDSHRNNGLSGNDIAQHQIWQLAGRWRVRIIHGLVAGLIVAGTFWFVIWIALRGHVVEGRSEREIEPVFSLVPPSTFTESVAPILFGCIFALFAVIPAMTDYSSAPKRVVWRFSRRDMGFFLLAGFGIVLVGTLLGVLLVGFSGGLSSLLGFVLVCGLGTGLTGGLLACILGGRNARIAPADERRIIRETTVASIVVGIVGGLGAGLIAGAVFTLGERNLVAAFEAGLLLGLGIGVMAILLMGGATLRFMIAAAIFRITNSFSARPAKFLIWAHESGLLRVTGAAYQFRHDTYQQWILSNPAPVKT